MVDHTTFIFLADAGLGELQEFERHAEVLFSIMTKSFITVLVLVALVYTVKVLLNSSYSIRQVNVPSSFDQTGHSGLVVANRINLRIQQIIQRVSATEFSKKYSTSAADHDVAVDVAGMGLPIKGFIEMLGTTFGIHRGKKIDIDLFIEGNSLIMLLRISGQVPERLEKAMQDSFELPLKSLILEAAEVILKYSNDEVLQTYFGIIEQIGEKQLRLAKYRYEQYKNNPSTEIKVVAALAWGYCMLKRYDEAEKIIRAGVPRFKKPGRIYMIWGMLLQQNGRHEEAIEKFQLAVRNTTRAESKYRKANILTSIGRSYVLLGHRDTAMEYFQKAVQLDDNSSGGYLNLAKMQLVPNNNKDLFYELLEKALVRGLRTQAVIQDPDCSPLLNEPSMKNLLEKYSAE